MATKHFQIEIDKDLKIPMKTVVAQKGTTIKAWASNVLRAALEVEIAEQHHQAKKRTKSAA